ncbi:uncharacterized protein N7443_003266 [Penicillium atrosanguineum]|uniref:uncharacterized protein n=1 Tax=Penicillium atrosanguineum TaxID=1132637 RepID=UPI0023842A64|nr:uncharacterized protein N7443_003266 [Penicillium atrosanguineum]KAJ5310805.1 hypothetical protein N7443_003266 [Penicillium atrosanguineum]
MCFRHIKYHVYHVGEEDFRITPFMDLEKEFGYSKKHKDIANDYARAHPKSDESNSYFIHPPAPLFHGTPRTIHHGSEKDKEPLCIIKSSAFWRVRSWRIWGETGKRYHRMVNAQRKTLKEKGEEEEEKVQPAGAEEVIRLKWSSPLMNARRYHFLYAGITFFWEGTRDLHVNEKWSRRLMPLNHLKLIAELPGGERLFLAQFTSDFSSKKFGKLWVIDSAVSKLLEIVDPFQGPDDSGSVVGFKSQPQSINLRESRFRFNEIILATAMCMVIGEWQKRLTLWFIVILIAESGKGANMAGAGGGGC